MAAAQVLSPVSVGSPHNPTRLDSISTISTSGDNSHNEDIASPSLLPSSVVPTAQSGLDIEKLAVDEDAARTLILEKMLSALRDMGYDDGAVEKVGGLIRRNLVSAHERLASLTDGEEKETQYAVTEAVARLLDPEILAKKDLRVNSNEPVLMIDVSKGKLDSVEDLHKLKDETLSELRNVWNVKPVRVYVCSADLVKDQSQFGLNLLNVVNTEVGGPSMVQLLDAAFHNEGWKQYLLSKEAWNGWDLIWRDDSGFQSTVEKPRHIDLPPAFDRFRESVAETKVDMQPLSEAPLYTPASPVPGTPSDLGEDDDKVGQVTPVHHPAYQALEEIDASRPTIQHPSWQHEEHAESLLDLIRRQASRAKVEADLDTAPADDVVEESDPSVKPSKPGSNDDFELV